MRKTLFLHCHPPVSMLLMSTRSFPTTPTHKNRRRQPSTAQQLLRPLCTLPPSVAATAARESPDGRPRRESSRWLFGRRASPWFPSPWCAAEETRGNAATARGTAPHRCCAPWMQPIVETTATAVACLSFLPVPPSSSCCEPEGAGVCRQARRADSGDLSDGQTHRRQQRKDLQRESNTNKRKESCLSLSRTNRPIDRLNGHSFVH